MTTYPSINSFTGISKAFAIFTAVSSVQVLPPLTAEIVLLDKPLFFTTSPVFIPFLYIVVINFTVSIFILSPLLSTHRKLYNDIIAHSVNIVNTFYKHFLKNVYNVYLLC
nr:MAG TPA: hypothetical protein [Caudoviricetes sp.]